MKDVSVTYDDRYHILKIGNLYYIHDLYHPNNTHQYYVEAEYFLLLLQCRVLNDEHHSYMSEVANYCKDHATFIRALWD